MSGLWERGILGEKWSLLYLYFCCLFVVLLLFGLSPCVCLLVCGLFACSLIVLSVLVFKSIVVLIGYWVIHLGGKVKMVLLFMFIFSFSFSNFDSFVSIQAILATLFINLIHCATFM